MGFFKPSELILKAPIPKLPQCGVCGLLKTCSSPKMAVAGKGSRKILIVGEAPGEQEDKQGKPFVGPAGQLLRTSLRKVGIDLDRDCWTTNSLICRPPKNATPTDKQIGYCRPNLINLVNELEPEIIVPLGGPAVDSLLAWLWKDDVKNISRWVGWKIPYQKKNCWVCPTYHPSYVQRFLDRNRVGSSVEKLLFEHHLEEMSKLEGRPWGKVPNYEHEVEVMLSTKEAAQTIMAFLEYGEIAAFDYETNMLKPDWEDRRIISCSICCGFRGMRRTISFPFAGPVVEAMRKFIRHPIPKIASNIKMEDRWSRVVLGKGVKNWFWDTMNGAHVYDNRPDITGLKFQSFVWLGVESYDDPIKRFLRTKGDDRINQVVASIELKRLLLYGGLDSLYEFLVCFKQRGAMGYANSEPDRKWALSCANTG
jgi:uracil-DNA glycosylase family 4